MTTDEALKLAIGKIKSARDCHFAAIDPLLFEAEEILEQALAAPVQEPVVWFDLLKQAEEVVRSKPLWKKYIDGTPLANDIAVWMASFAQEHITPPAAQPVPVQEPSGFFRHEDVCGDEVGPPTPYYLTPPAAQRQWVEVEQVKWDGEKFIAKLKEKNT